MSAQSLRVTAIEAQFLSYSDVTGSFTPFGGPMPAPIQNIKN